MTTTAAAIDTTINTGSESESESGSKPTTIGPYQLLSAVLPLSEIDFGERFRKDYEDGGELEDSIKTHGILQSLLVLFRPGSKYLLLAGGRRYKIAERLQLPTVPVLIATRSLDEYDIRMIELIENVHRRNPNFNEDCRLKAEIHRLQQERFGKSLGGSSDRKGWSLEDTAKMLGTSKATIAQDIQLAEAIEKLPTLAACKDKTEARKVLNQLIQKVERSEKAKAYEQDMQSGPKKRLSDSYIIGDFFDKIPLLPDSSFDFVELDPFYGIELLDLYAKRSTSGISYRKEDYPDVPPAVYEWYIQETLRQCHRVMTDNSWGICWFAMEPWFEPTYQAIISAGFYCRRVPGFWVQPTGAAYNANLLLASTVDSFFYFRKGQPRLNTPGTLNSFLFNPVVASNKIHPTERPIELYDKIISTFVGPNSRMLVPFTGSGNQLLSCSNLGIHGIGFDISPAYKPGYVIRVNEGEFGHYKSYK